MDDNNIIFITELFWAIVILVCPIILFLILDKIGNKFGRYDNPGSEDILKDIKVFLPWNLKYARYDWRSVKEDIITILLFLVSIMFFQVHRVQSDDLSSFTLTLLICSISLTIFSHIYMHIVVKPAIQIHWIQKYIDSEENNRKKEYKYLALIYRKLAKKYHPDLARTLPQKVYFDRTMKKINEAYSKRDLKTLVMLVSVENVGEL